jgi:DNA-directed RNA polymerase alpha subunit
MAITGTGDWHSIPLTELGLSARSLWIAERAGATTVGQLCDLSAVELFSHTGFSETAFREIPAKLAEHGLRLRGAETTGRVGLAGQELLQRRSADPGDHELERKLNMSLAELELSVPATNCLESEGISTVRDLVIRNDDELLDIRNFSDTTLKEVKAKLAERGLHLGMQLGR